MSDDGTLRIKPSNDSVSVQCIKISILVRTTVSTLSNPTDEIEVAGVRTIDCFVRVY
jgi:hypothetical protein